MKIGLLSDTHSYLDKAVFTHFDPCDEIWHAGDFGNLAVVEELEAFKPLRGVYGNIDEPAIRSRFPEDLRFFSEQVDVWMTHIGGYPGRYAPRIKAKLTESPPKLFISGHSHILKVMYDKQFKCLHLNPGAAGKQGWQKVRTLMRFDLVNSEILNLEVIELSNK